MERGGDVVGEATECLGEDDVAAVDGGGARAGGRPESPRSKLIYGVEARGSSIYSEACCCCCAKSTAGGETARRRDCYE